MNNRFLIKTISVFLFIFLVAGFYANIFEVKKIQAQQSLGSAAGAAVAAGLACFVESKLEMLVKGLTDEMTGAGKSRVREGANIEAVPTVNGTQVIAEDKAATNAAFASSRDCIRDVVVKKLIDFLVDKTVEWIQGGGKPAFVTDWKNFGKDAFNAGVGEVINNTNLSFLCSPFQAQIKLALLPVPKFSKQISCTLDKIVKNIQNFTIDFSQGGWDAYVASWQPQNNFFGTYALMYDEALMKGRTSQTSWLSEAAAGKGFLSMKRCKKYDEAYIKECEKYGGTGCRDVAAACEKYEIVTPGDTIGQTVANAIASDMRWAENVKSWVAAISNALINRLTQQGLAHLSDAYVAGGDYDYYKGYQNQRTAELGTKTLKSKLKDYRKIIYKLGKVLEIEEQILSKAKDIQYIVSGIQSGSCTAISSSLAPHSIPGYSQAISQSASNVNLRADDVESGARRIKNWQRGDKFCPLGFEIEIFGKKVCSSGPYQYHCRSDGLNQARNNNEEIKRQVNYIRTDISEINKLLGDLEHEADSDEVVDAVFQIRDLVDNQISPKVEAIAKNAQDISDVLRPIGEDKAIYPFCPDPMRMDAITQEVVQEVEDIKRIANEIIPLASQIITSASDSFPPEASLDATLCQVSDTDTDELKKGKVETINNIVSGAEAEIIIYQNAQKAAEENKQFIETSSSTLDAEILSKIDEDYSNYLEKYQIATEIIANADIITPLKDTKELIDGILGECRQKTTCTAPASEATSTPPQ